MHPLSRLNNPACFPKVSLLFWCSTTNVSSSTMKQQQSPSSSVLVLSFLLVSSLVIVGFSLYCSIFAEGVLFFFPVYSSPCSCACGLYALSSSDMHRREPDLAGLEFVISRLYASLFYLNEGQSSCHIFQKR